MGKRKRILEKVLFILYIAAVAVLFFAKFSGDVDLNSTILGIPKDKIVHFAMFLPYTIVFSLAFYNPSGKPWRLVGFLVLALAIAVASGAATELIQAHIKYRSADIKDFQADCIGSFTGAFISLILCTIAKKY